MSKSCELEDENTEMRGCEDTTSDVLVDDYKDLELEIMASSREKTLWWIKHILKQEKALEREQILKDIAQRLTKRNMAFPIIREIVDLPEQELSGIFYGG